MISNYLSAWLRRIPLLGAIALARRASAKNRSAHQRRPQLAPTPLATTPLSPLAATLLLAVGLVLSASAQAQTALTFSVATIAGQTFAYDDTNAITPLSLPVASGGSGDLTYTLEDPAGRHTRLASTGLSFNPNSRTEADPPTLIGRPRLGVDTVFTYTATDTAGTEVSLPFRLTITGAPSFGDQTLEEMTYIRGVELATPLTLPEAMFSSSVSYSNLSEDGTTQDFLGTLGFQTAGRSGPYQVMGTPNRAGAFWAQLRVAGGNTGNLITRFFFRIVVLPADTLVFAETIAGQTYAYDDSNDITPLTLPLASGGSGDLTYTLEDPAGRHTRLASLGLNFNANDGTVANPPTLSGMPNLGVDTVFTYTATDTAGTEASLPFRLTITGAPHFGDQTLEELTYIRGVELSTPLTLPEAIFSGAVRYSNLSEDGTTQNFLGTTLGFETAGAVGGPYLVMGTPNRAGAFGVQLRVVAGSTGNLITRFFFRIVILSSDSLLFEETIAGQTYAYDGSNDITPLTLPLARGGSGTLTYTLEDPVGRHTRLTGTGLTLLNAIGGTVADPPILSGMPNLGVDTVFTYTATDTAGTEASLPFRLTITGAPHFGDQTLEEQTYTVGVEITTPLTLPEPMFSGAVRYSNLSEDGTTQSILESLGFETAGEVGGPYQVMGTPNRAGASWVQLRVADRDTGGLISRFFFRIVVLPAATTLAFTPGSIADRTYTMGTEIRALTLPNAVNGAVPYTFTLEGAPDGLSFNDDADMRILSGTPSTVGDSDLSYKVRDADDAEVSLIFAITVEAPIAACEIGTSILEFYTHEIPFPGNLVWAVDIPVDLPLPFEAPDTALVADESRFEIPYYELRNAPAGIELTNVDLADEDFGSPTLAGTPQETGAFTMLYRIRDDRGCIEQSLPVTVKEAGALVFTSIQVNQTYTADFPIAAQTLPEATGGTTPYTFTLEGAPDGLSFTADTRTLSGSSSTEGDSELSYTVRDAAGDEVLLIFTVTISPPLAFNPPSLPPQTYTADFPITVLTLPQPIGGLPRYTFSLQGEPTNLRPLFTDTSPLMRIVSGTPDTVGDFDVIHTVRDANGNEVSLTFAIRVNSALIFGATTIDDQTYESGTSSTMTFPEATGGSGTITYTVENPNENTRLPTGLALDAAAAPPTVGGSTSKGVNAVFTYTATDGAGAKLPLPFRIIVTGAPNFGDATLEPLTYIQGMTIPPLTLPEAMHTDTVEYQDFSAAGTADFLSTLGFQTAGADGGPYIVTGEANQAGEFSLRLQAEPSASSASSGDFYFNIVIQPPLAFDTAAETALGVASGGLTFIRGEDVSIILPAAVGGTDAASYTLLDADGANIESHGLTYRPAARGLVGQPSSSDERFTLTYTVSDASETDSLTFTLTLQTPTPEFDPAEVAAQEFSLGTELALTLPVASNATDDTASFGYTLTPDLEDQGLTFIPADRILRGAPTASIALTEFTYTATQESLDYGGGTSSLNFNITILSTLIFTPATVADQTFMVGVPIADLTLPVATEGTAAYSYTLDGVPAGLSFNADADERILSGTPTAADNAMTLTFTATDSEGNSITLEFNVEVAPNTLAFADDATIADQTYTATAAITALELPTAMGGIAPLAYTLSSDPPASLSFADATDTAPPTLSGTPNAEAASTEVVYTVTDSSTVPRSATLTFNLFVAAAPVLPTQDALSYPAGFPLQDLPTQLTLPEITSGGVAPVSYSLGGLPASLSFDSTSRTLSGAADAAGDSELTFAATDSNDAVAVVTFTLTITAALTFTEQSGANHVRSGETYRVDPISLALEPPLTLPAFGGGDGALSATLTGPAGDSDLSGLTFDASSRVLTGMLESATAGGNFVWTVSDGSGAFATLNFAIRSTGPYFADSTQQSDLTFVQGTQASVTLLAANTDQAQPDAASVSYTLLDADGAAVPTILPGLAFASATRTLSGTPTAGKNPIALSYTVSDGEGNTDTAIFNVEIIPDPLAFASGANIADQSYTATATITLDLPTATGGIEALVYTLSSGLPAGLSFAADTNPPTLSGAPDAATANTQLLYTVTDSSIAPQSATLTFNIFVAAPPVLTQGALTYTAGFPLENLPTPPTLPQITSGGIAPISYAVAGLPANLVFDPASRALTGAAAAAASSALTYTATDSNTAVATAIFTLQIDAPLTFTEEVGSHHVRSGETYRVDPISLSLEPPLTLPAFGGGDNTLSGALTGPAGDDDLGGLVLDLATRILSGTLRSQDAGGDYVWTVSDSSGAFTTLTFSLRSAGPYFEDSTQQSDLTFMQGEQGSAILLEANTAQAQPDAASVVYALSDPNGEALSTLLPGLAFNPATRTLSGTPTAGKNPMPLSYTATDGDGNSDTLIFNVSITALPLGFAGTVTDQSYVVNVPIDTLPLPPAQDGIAGYNYALSGAPAGLIFNATANPPTISGAPADDTEGNYSLTYTVTDSAAGAPGTASLIFAINVVPLIFVPDSIDDPTFTINIPATLVLPAAAGGTSPYAYTLNDLPPGLTFEANGGTEQDPPTLVGSPEDDTRGEYPLVYTVTDSNTPSNHTLSLNFTLTVIEGTAHFAILNRVLLPEIARAVADQNISAITQRISRVRSNRKSQDPENKLAQANLGGQDSWAGLLHSHGLTLLKGDQLNGRDILSKSNFVLPLNTKQQRRGIAPVLQDANLSLWGSGSYRDLSGEDSGVDWEGELSGAHLGLDTLIGERLLLGFVISQNRSDLNYEFENKSGAHQVDITNFNPYFSWASESERLEIWATAGFGYGELEIDDDNVSDTASSDVGMFSLGAGVRGTILHIDNNLQLRLRGDALQASLEVDETRHIENRNANVSRLRLALELAGSLPLFSGGHLEPLMDLGLRHDGDDGAERNAVELGFSLRHRIPRLGLTLSGRLHLLVGAQDYNEYGAQASLQLQPNPEKGLSLHLSSGYGADATPEAQQIWQRDLSPQTPTPTPETPQVNARLSYNIPTPTRRHHTLLTPYTELTADSHALGLNWTLPAATLQLEWANKHDEAPKTELKARIRF